MNIIQESPIIDKFFEYSSNHLCLIDAQGNIRALNPAWAMKSGEKMDSSHASIFDWIHDEDKMAVQEALTTIEEKGSLDSLKFRLAGEAIRPIWLEGTCTFDPFTGLIYGCFSDVSEKVEMQEILADTQEKFDFIYKANKLITEDLTHAEKSMELLVKASVPVLADWCSVDVTGESGEIRRIGVAHEDPRKNQVCL